MASTWEWTRTKHPGESESRSISDGVPPSTVALSSAKIDKFWQRVAQITARSQVKPDRWLGLHEIKLWNAKNLTPCNNCTLAKRKHLCAIDLDNHSCRTCRNLKRACDRKAQFVFDITKSEFFNDYDQFMAVYNEKPAMTMKGHKRKENKRRRTINTVVGEQSSGPALSVIFLPSGLVKVCSICIRSLEYDLSSMRAGDHDTANCGAASAFDPVTEFKRKQSTLQLRATEFIPCRHLINWVQR
ncbi:hypothetical protein FB451DRAFT_1190859 [Mycena latifolia]|nr:hypothetical protein FB451DRAFT_1190859 [Mycena latifolia]